MGILLNASSRVVIQGITGREASVVASQMKSYGTRVVGGVTPGRGGESIDGLPVFDSMRQLFDAVGPAEIALVYVPPASVLDAVWEAVDAGIELICVITEQVPVHDVMRARALVGRSGARMIGPNSTGVIDPGARVRVGPIGGDDADRCFAPGHTGIISRSGGMLAETAWMLKRAGFGTSTAVSIGGDPVLGLTASEYITLFESDPSTDAIAMFAEPGTRLEDEVADVVSSGLVTKPVCAFVAGRFTERMPRETAFGHAAAMISSEGEAPSRKIERLREGGVQVAERFDDLPRLLAAAVAKRSEIDEGGGAR